MERSPMNGREDNVTSSTRICQPIHAAHVARQGYNEVNSTNIPIDSGSQSVFKESHAICNQFPRNLWMYFCNGCFQVNMHVN